MNYAERIRALREDHDKTQSEIAGLLKVGQRTCCDYEHGKTRIPVDSLFPSHYRAGSGLSPFRFCPCRVHSKNPECLRIRDFGGRGGT